MFEISGSGKLNRNLDGRASQAVDVQEILFKLIPKLRISYGDEGLRSLTDGFSLERGYPVFGDNVRHIVPGCCDGLTSIKCGDNPGCLAFRCGGWHGDDAAAVGKVVTAFPEQFRPDVRGGFGMGVAFTHINKMDAILEQITPFKKESSVACFDYLTGAAMGLAIRYQTDSGYVREMMKLGSPQTRTLAQTLLEASQIAFDEVQQGGLEMHKNWRTAIHNQITGGRTAATLKKACEEKSQ